MSDPNSDLLDADDVAAQAASLADHLSRAGVQFLPKPDDGHVATLTSRFAAFRKESPEQSQGSTATTSSSSPSIPASSIPATTAPQPTAPRRSNSVAPVESASGPYPGDPLPIAERQTCLESLRGEVADCTRCEVLAGCRSNTVFGEGNAEPRVVFFGEGPGADEDRLGRPFVGKAGQLLTKMIEACKFKREDVYIMNTVKCRPPGNRNPEIQELENCRSFYQQQLQILRPEYIVCLGAISSQELLKSKLSVGRLRGKFHRYHESKVLVTYHPAYLLRTPSAKKAAWEDLQIMLRDAGLIGN